jgi:DNA-binding MarR family transcriptional regulator
MSRIVAGLKRSGLARIEVDEHDQRRVRISVTAKGEQILQEARRRRIQALAETFAGLDEAQLEVLARAAEIIEQALRH